MTSPDELHPTANMPRIGDTLVGKYRIEQFLGKGGMGVVAAARHVQLGQRVAIKFLIHADHEETVERFLREARAAVRLHSQHVARVLDVGKLDTGAPYMVMEYLEGCDLARHVRTNGPLDVAEAVLHVLQTCEAIAEAHALGIIHRDLKPANLFLTTTPDGETCVKVLDFGISKTNDKAEDGAQAYSITHADDVLGSPLYMPPEQLKSSKSVDMRSDIWAIGVILYQLLTGRTPWASNVLHELVLSISMDPAPPLATFRSDVPAKLEEVVKRCLEKRREFRFDNVAELAWALAEFGPPHAEQSAKRATRLLEAAGIRVRRQAGEIEGVSRATPTLPSARSTTAIAVVAEPVADTMSNAPTELKARSARKKHRSLGFVAAAGACLLLVVGLAWSTIRGSTATTASLPVQATSNVATAPEVLPAREPSAEPTTQTAPTLTASSGPNEATAPTALMAPMALTNSAVQEKTNSKKKIAQPATNQTAPNAHPAPSTGSPPAVERKTTKTDAFKNF